MTSVSVHMADIWNILFFTGRVLRKPALFYAFFLLDKLFYTPKTATSPLIIESDTSRDKIREAIPTTRNTGQIFFEK